MKQEKLSSSNAALLLIDHQVGTLAMVKSISPEDVKRNALMLAEAASKLRMPVVLTSSMENQQQGPLLEELQSLLPDAFADRIQRKGVINSMDDERFAAAVTATGRSTFIVAGVTNDVCTRFPSTNAGRTGTSCVRSC